MVLSALLMIKSTYWSTLKNTEDSLCPVLSNIPPDLTLYAKNKQGHTYQDYVNLLSSLIQGKFLYNIYLKIFKNKCLICVFIVCTYIPRVIKNFFFFFQKWGKLRSPALDRQDKGNTHRVMRGFIRLPYTVGAWGSSVMHMGQTESSEALSPRSQKLRVRTTDDWAPGPGLAVPWR